MVDNQLYDVTILVAFVERTDEGGAYATSKTYKLDVSNIEAFIDDVANSTAVVHIDQLTAK